MTDRRKFSLFVSSTFEDLKEERQALFSVALENNFIPVGMEQFHGAPTSQWNVIMKMVDECDFYLIILGGRYGSIDESIGISYTEKEYNYAKEKNLPVLVLIKKESSITEDKKDLGDDKYEKMRKLDEFRNKVRNDGNTVDFFGSIDELKYVASQTLKNAVAYADENIGWVRYQDITDVINEEAEARNKIYKESGVHQQKVFDDLKSMLIEIGSRLTDVEKNQTRLEEMPAVSKEDVEKLFRVEGDTLVIGNKINSIIPKEEKLDLERISPESALLLIYAAEGNGQIIKTRCLGSPDLISTAGRRFMAEETPRESAKWTGALIHLIELGWVKSVGYKGEIFELTLEGYKNADLLKKVMKIDTSREPLEELREFENNSEG